jgi:hypothetical protein
MPKYNPKRDKTQASDNEAPKNAPKKKEKGTYFRKASSHGKFYGIIIIAVFLVGLIYILYQQPQGPTGPVVAQWDHVELNLCIWTDAHYFSNATAPPAPDANVTYWYNFTTIYQNSTDTNTSVLIWGLPVGIYSGVGGNEGVLGKSVNYKSNPIYIQACTDPDKTGYDSQNPTQKAYGWGFINNDPLSKEFFNTTIIVTYVILNLTKVGSTVPVTSAVSSAAGTALKGNPVFEWLMPQCEATRLRT